MAMKEQKSGKIFYGWWIVLVAGIGLAVHFGPILGITFGVFLKSLSQEFGWSRAQVSLAFSLSTLGMTLAIAVDSGVMLKGAHGTGKWRTNTWRK